jgi:hypothetical protein
MTPRREDGSTLSVHRAFVVHLRADGGPRRARFAGRVEHLSSGRSVLFSSLRELLAFFAPVLDTGGQATSPGPGPGSDPPSRISPPQEAPPGCGRSREAPAMTSAPDVAPRPRRQRHAGKARREGGIHEDT